MLFNKIVFLLILIFLSGNIWAQDEDFADFDDFDMTEIESDSSSKGFDAEELKLEEKQPVDEVIKEQEITSNDIPTDVLQTYQEEELPERPISDAIKTIQGIHYLQKQGFSQVIIRVNEPAHYKAFVEDEGRLVVVHIKNTRLPDKWKRFLDTSEFRSAISFVRPYSLPNVRQGSKVVVQLRDSVAVDVKRNGSDIVIQVEIPERYYKAHPKDLAPKVKEKVYDDELGDEAFADEDLINEDDELAQQLKEEGELEQGAFEEDIDVPMDDGTFAQQTSEDEYLGVSMSDIEGFTVKELEEDMKYTGKPITVTFKEAPLIHVMDFFSEICGMNIVMGDDISGTISIKLKNVPWDQALSLVLRTKSLGAVRHGNVIRIAKWDTLRKEQEDLKASIDARKVNEQLKTFVIPINYAEASNMMGLLKNFVGQSKGTISVDSRTNTLILKDTDRNIRLIKNLITTLDTQTPQVLIEARIIEVSEGYSHGLNIAWEAIGGKLLNTPLSTLSNVSVGDTNFSGTSRGSFSLGFLNLSKLGDVTAQLQIGESRNEVKLLSAPRIITQDNQKATITQTDTMVIPGQRITTNLETNTVVTENQQVTATLTLDVTPQITSDGSVAMSINISNEFFKDQIGTKGSRQANTRVLVGNGDTTVIGGIYSKSKTKNESGVPVLSWLPMIGWLFRSQTETEIKTELLIFLTPTITNIERAFVAEEHLSDESDEEYEENVSNETETQASQNIEAQNLEDNVDLNAQSWENETNEYVEEADE